MPVPLLDLQAQYESIRDEVDRAIASVVASQRFVLGPMVESLEEKLADFVGVPHAIGCASGTDALLLPLRALEPSAEDEVVVPAFTFFATAGAVWNAGMVPAFCDVDADSFNVTAETVDRALNDRTRAVIPVHLFGQMAPMEEVLALTASRGIRVIEDAAQAIGASRRTDSGASQMAGSSGWAGAFSFFPTKNLGGFGDGGLITTSDGELAEVIRKLRVHGGRQMYHHEMVGTNSRLDALQAAVLLAKLGHLHDWNEARRANAALYEQLLAAIPEVILPCTIGGNRHVFNQYTIRVPRRDALREHLAVHGVGTGIYYPVPLHLQKCFTELGYAEGDFPVAESLCREVLSLPIYAEVGERRIREVAGRIAEFFGCG